ncbi:MAG: MFS transporter [Clostridia bacterium]|nr:MFS transporter [Clostridia bacterium]
MKNGLLKRNNLKTAILLGTLCSISYFAVYVARNILSAVSPQMLESGVSEEYIGMASSLFFAVYAVGQLINGQIGDKIKARHMISFGLILAGICNLAVRFIPASNIGFVLIYGVSGFFLAMIYAPMTKVVAENVDPIYVVRCSTGYEVACLLGTPVAGLLAALLPVCSVFFVGGSFLLLIGMIAFVCFRELEKKNLVRYGRYEMSEKGGKAKVKVLLKYQIVKFCLIAVITGIVRTSVVFWLPTYLSQYLGFSPQRSATVFSTITLIISLTVFIAVFVYERFGSMNKTILLMFSIAAVAFGCVWLIKHPILNIVCLVIAIMGSGCVASIMWCKYCPGLRDTGMVSSVTGFLDFLSYMAAALANIIFANAVSAIGWKNLILVWMSLMIAGILISFPYGIFIKKAHSEECD